MDVIFELLGGSSFSVTVDFFDTISEIKYKIQLYHGIPVSEQTFIFDGQVLEDRLDIWTSQLISPGSTILLLTSDQVANLAAAALPMPNVPAEAVNLMAAEFPPPTEVSSMPNMPLVADFLGMQELHSWPPPPRHQEGYDFLGMPITQVPQTPTTIPGYALPSMPEFPRPPHPRRVEIPMPCMPPQRRPPLPTLNTKELASRKDSPLQLPSKKILLDVKIPASEGRVHVLMDVNDTVLKLKEEIQRKVMDRILLQLHTTRVELLDNMLLKDCGVSTDNREIDMFIKPSLLPAAADVGCSSGGGGGCDKLMVTVLIVETKVKIAMEVNASDNVEVLREELEKLKQKLKFRLPKDGSYFFVHNWEKMDEDKSFQWYRVNQGDTIETLWIH